MTVPAVAFFALLSAVIVTFHIAAWLATYPSTGAEGFWARTGWPGLTTPLGLAWTAALVFACWCIVRAPAPRPVLTLAVLACTVMTPEILSAVVNVPYKGVSASEFLDAFLLPGGLTPGGNGTMQHFVTSAAVGGLAAVQIAHGSGRARIRARGAAS